MLLELTGSVLMFMHQLIQLAMRTVPFDMFTYWIGAAFLSYQIILLRGTSKNLPSSGMMLTSRF